MSLIEKIRNGENRFVEFKEKGGFFSVIIYRKHLSVSGLVAD